MRLHPAIFSALLVVTAISPNILAQKPNNEPKNSPLISKPARILSQADFSAMPKGNWEPGSGEISIADGILTLTAQKSDKDRASFNNQFGNVDHLVVSLRFKLHTAESLTVAVNGIGRDNAPTGSGAICQVGLNVKALAIRADATKLAVEKVTLAPDQWHDLMIEIVNDKVIVQIDGEKVAEVENASISRNWKNRIGFGIHHGQALIDYVVVGQVFPIK